MHIASGHVHATGETRCIGVKGQLRRGDALDQVGAFENLNHRCAAGPGRGDDVRLAVMVNISSRYSHAAGEAAVEGEKIVKQAAVLTAEDADARLATGILGHDYVREAVVVKVG